MNVKEIIIIGIVVLFVGTFSAYIHGSHLPKEEPVVEEEPTVKVKIANQLSPEDLCKRYNGIAKYEPQECVDENGKHLFNWEWEYKELTLQEALQYSKEEAIIELCKKLDNCKYKCGGSLYGGGSCVLDIRLNNYEQN